MSTCESISLYLLLNSSLSETCRAFGFIYIYTLKCFINLIQIGINSHNKTNKLIMLLWIYLSIFPLQRKWYWMLKTTLPNWFIPNYDLHFFIFADGVFHPWTSCSILSYFIKQTCDFFTLPVISLNVVALHQNPAGRFWFGALVYDLICQKYRESIEPRWSSFPADFRWKLQIEKGR